MTTSNGFLNAPEFEPNTNNWLRKIVRVINGIMQGKTNNTGSVTLTANSATTTVTETGGRIGQNTLILFMPTTAHAATEFGAGTMYVSARSVANNTFTITHVNNAQNDRTFNYVLIG
jgi:LDH2 family malate/lactate/ureidoglycolate dehydrogenase